MGLKRDLCGLSCFLLLLLEAVVEAVSSILLKDDDYVYVTAHQPSQLSSRATCDVAAVALVLTDGGGRKCRRPGL